MIKLNLLQSGVQWGSNDRRWKLLTWKWDTVIVSVWVLSLLSLQSVIQFLLFQAIVGTFQVFHDKLYPSPLRPAWDIYVPYVVQ